MTDLPYLASRLYGRRCSLRAQTRGIGHV